MQAQGGPAWDMQALNCHGVVQDCKALVRSGAGLSFAMDWMRWWPQTPHPTPPASKAKPADRLSSPIPAALEG
eukprot:354940-Chlamydomonas_euryale.AAC.2